MFKWSSFLTGAILASGLTWVITADHYGHIVRADPVAGIMCRVHDYEHTVMISDDWRGPWSYYCTDMLDAAPEAQLWDEMRELILSTPKGDGDE